MTTNGHHHHQDLITVLYKVVNCDSDSKGGLYNAFQMPRGAGVTLATVKQYCTALSHINHLGAEGFHWRVCIEDKQPSGHSSKGPLFSWWDIQDENARLPVKDFSMSQIDSMFMQEQKYEDDEAKSAGTTAKGALKGMAKAMGAMAVSAVDAEHGPRVPLVAFKLLDLVRMHDDFGLKHGGTKGHAAPLTHKPTPIKPTRPAPPSRPQPPPQQQQRQQPPPQRQPPPQQQPQQRQPQQPSANLMDFGPPSSGARHFQHSASMPPSFNNNNNNESRAERLKREYQEKQQKAHRVWDDVDQRWVEVDGPIHKPASQSAPPESGSNAKKLAGISLDTSNAIGKSANVQAAVHARVSEMKESQEKAVHEIRKREAQKAAADMEEDEVRRRLEPQIKTWSEEHGKKKQLRALLASLHTILWPGAGWKQIGIGDLLDDAKVKRAFHKASRVVHPDKTGDLDAEKRFLAKRIFDALSQAKTEFDEGAK